MTFWDFLEGLPVFVLILLIIIYIIHTIGGWLWSVL